MDKLMEEFAEILNVTTDKVVELKDSEWEIIKPPKPIIPSNFNEAVSYFVESKGEAVLKCILFENEYLFSEGIISESTKKDKLTPEMIKYGSWFIIK